MSNCNGYNIQGFNIYSGQGYQYMLPIFHSKNQEWLQMGATQYNNCASQLASKANNNNIIHIGTNTQCLNKYGGWFKKIGSDTSNNVCYVLVAVGQHVNGNHYAHIWSFPGMNGWKSNKNTDYIINKYKKANWPTSSPILKDEDEVGDTFIPTPPEPGKTSNENNIVSPSQCFRSGSIFVEQEIIAFNKFTLTLAPLSEIEEALKIDISSPLSFDKFAVTPHIAYIKSIKETKYTISTTFYSIYTLPTQVYANKDSSGEELLTEHGKNLLKQDVEKFLEACGDYLITEVKRSAVFMVNIKIIFENKISKDNFEAELSGQGQDINSIMASYSSVINSLAISAYIELSAIQFGGSHYELAKLFNKDEKDQFYIVKCAFNNSDACFNVANSILEYAHTFISQLEEYKEKGGLLTMIKEKVENYLPSEKLKNTKAMLSTREHREYLSTAYEELFQYKKEMPFIIKNPEFKKNIARKDFEKFKSTDIALKNLLKTLEDENYGAVQCYKTSGNCEEVVQAFKREFNNIDTTFIEKFNVAFQLKTAIGFDTITYVLPALTGLAVTVLGYYFTNTITDTVLKAMGVGAGVTLLGEAILMYNSAYKGMKLWPYYDGEKYVYYHTLDDSRTIIFDPDSLALTSEYNCPQLSTNVGKYSATIDKNFSKCLGNWASVCEYKNINCVGSIFIEEIDILDEILI